MKKLGVFFLGVMLAFSLIGCSSGSSGNGGSDGQGTQGNGSSEKEVTLTIGLPGGYDVTPKSLIDGFKKEHPNIHVEISQAPWNDFHTKLATQIAGHTAPDVWIGESFKALGHGKRGVVMDLSSRIEELNVDEYAKASLFAAQSPDGKVYGVPHDDTVWALFYNKKLFKEAGVPFPTKDWTFQDMIDASKKLTKDTNGDGKPDVYGMLVNSTISAGWLPWSRAYGGGIINEEGTKSLLAEPKTIKGFEKYAAMINDLHAAPTIEWTDAIKRPFAKGKVAMEIGQSSNIRVYNKKFPDLDWDAVLVPKGFNGERTVPDITNVWMVYSQSKVKDAAWEFLNYVLSPEAQKIIASSGIGLPSRLDAYPYFEEMEGDPANKKAFTVGAEKYGTPVAPSLGWSEWRAKIEPLLNKIHDGAIPVEEGLKEAAEKMQEVLDNVNK